ncbi:tetratricopeptide repeat-containing protein [Terrimicrobium sacchariphilum]|uniref:Tetratricopeptide repeat-containing protein n=1 Tax=Terrimicrobium sacchariphilum TaxID=690879 RepID=A0A146G782_TERSA|nr:hypothetical protein [Terrimicrobium sacchariphilum]GAT32747.1 tetratricopeptide repeat-containing protein [Terrimicrobium sacchariphilum]
MLRRAAVFVFTLGTSFALDPSGQRLADRYWTILVANPTQTSSLERLWTLYDKQGESAQLIALARQRAGESPLLCAQVLALGGYRDEAIKLVEPLAVSSGPAALLLAGWTADAGHPADAARLLEKSAVALRDPALWIGAGEIWAKAGDSLSASSAWKQALSLAPGDLALLEKLAKSATAAGDWKSAAAYWREIAATVAPSQRVEAWEAASRAAEKGGDLDAAVEDQEKALSLLGEGHWKTREIQDRVFSLAERSGRMPQLEASLLMASAAEPSAAGPALRLAAFYQYRGDGAKRFKWIAQAAAVRPQDLALQREAARLALAIGDLDAAAALSRKASSGRTQDADTLFLQAEVDALQGRSVEAGKMVEQFVASQKGDEAIRERALDFYRRLHLNDALERELQRTVQADPRSVDAVLNLARFEADRGNHDAGEKALRRFPLDKLTKEEQGAAAARFVAFYQDANLLSLALPWAYQAFAASPSPANALALSRLLVRKGQTSEAGDILVQAALLPGDIGEEAERSLISDLQAISAGSSTFEPGGQRRLRSVMDSLSLRARNGGTETDWLRLARWQRFLRATDSYQQTLATGLSLYPSSRPLRNAFIDALVADGRYDGAIAQLNRLVKTAEPSEMVALQRRIGYLEIERGQPDQALAIFESIRNDNPKDWQALSDVAFAQQAGGNWFAALESWLFAYRLAPPDAKRSLVQSILGAASRLQQFARVLDFLAAACESERNSDARAELSRAAAAYSSDHQLTDAWLEILRDKAGRSDDAFWKQAQADALLAAGRTEEAREAGGVFTASLPRDEESLKAAVGEAVRAGNWGDAARLTGLLIALEKEPDLSAWQQRAEYLEKAGLWSQAREAWAAVSRRFAREPAALLAVAQFQERDGRLEESERSYRMAGDLAGNPPAILFRLGRLAQDRGDRLQAATDLEKLLAVTPASAATALLLPIPPAYDSGDEISVASATPVALGIPRDTWPRPAESDARGVRLLAIRDLARMLADSPKRAEWIASLTDPSERVWALYFSGDKGAAIREASAAAAKHDALSPRGEYLMILALDAGAWSELSSYLAQPADHRAARWKSFQTALTFLLEKGWQPPSKELTTLISSAPASARWEICRALASQGQGRLACWLAESIPASFPSEQAAQAWIDIGTWRLNLRQPDAARQAFDNALALSPGDISYSRPFFAALRARWMLTPPAERAAVEKKILQQAVATRKPGFPEAVEAFFAALAGNYEKAGQLLEEVFQASRGAQDASWTDIVQLGGSQLERWGMNRLARELYRTSLESDRALAVLRGEDFSHGAMSMLVQNRLINDDHTSAAYLAGEWSAGGARVEDVLQSVRQLLAASQGARAAFLIDFLAAQPALDDTSVITLFTFTGEKRARESLRGLVLKALESGSSVPLRIAATHAALRLAIGSQQDGATDEELALMQRISGPGAMSPAFNLQYAQALTRLGRHREALAVLEAATAMAPDPGPYIMNLAELLAWFGREREAAVILEKQASSVGPNRTVAAQRLAALADILGDQRRKELAERVLKEDGLDSAAQRLPESPEEWRGRLRDLRSRYKQSREQFNAVSNYVLSQPLLPVEVRTEEMARLQAIATQYPALIPAYYLFRKNLAARDKRQDDFRKELTAEWRQGAGQYFAGEMLIHLAFEEARFDLMSALLDEYLTDRNFQPTAWRLLAQRLMEERQYALAERVLAASMQRSDGDAATDLTLAEARWRQGKPVADILARIDAIGSIDPARRLDLARFYARTNQPDLAAAQLRAMDGYFPAEAGTGGVWAQVATNWLERGRISDAGDVLAMLVERWPQHVSGRLLADYHEALGAAAQPEEMLPLLSFQTRLDYRAAIFADLVSRGDVDAARAWVMAHPESLRAPEVRAGLQRLEVLDWPKMARVWGTVAPGNTLWEVQAAAAAFQARYAAQLETEGKSPLSALGEAHRLQPGEFNYSRAYARALVKNGKPAQAIKVLETTVKSYASPEDRRAAQTMLDSLRASPRLPDSA